jgi:hypothetical protein
MLYVPKLMEKMEDDQKFRRITILQLPMVADFQYSIAELQNSK